MYNWIILLYSRKEDNIANKLYYNKINFKKECFLLTERVQPIRNLLSRYSIQATFLHLPFFWGSVILPEAHPLHVLNQSLLWPKCCLVHSHRINLFLHLPDDPVGIWGREGEQYIVVSSSGDSPPLVPCRYWFSESLFIPSEMNMAGPSTSQRIVVGQWDHRVHLIW